MAEELQNGKRGNSLHEDQMGLRQKGDRGMQSMGHQSGNRKGPTKHTKKGIEEGDSGKEW